MHTHTLAAPMAQLAACHLGRLRTCGAFPTLRRHSLALALLLLAVPASSSNLGGDCPAVRTASEWLAPGKPTLTLEAADEMASAALTECRSKGFKDISVFVLDAAGRTLVSKSMVNVPTLIPRMAEAKAGAVIGTHASSRALKDKYVPDRTPQLLAMTTLAGNANLPFCAVPGGVLCRDKASNAILGAIGVSGASADEDEHCAIVGAQSVGCATEPPKSAL